MEPVLFNNKMDYLLNYSIEPKRIKNFNAIFNDFETGHWILNFNNGRRLNKYLIQWY